jgi:hypothetical protein
MYFICRVMGARRLHSSVQAHIGHQSYVSTPLRNPAAIGLIFIGPPDSIARFLFEVAD